MFFFKKKNPQLDILKSDYFVLALGLSAGFVGYISLTSSPELQAGAVIAIGIFYILWGTIHHAKEKNFHLSILLEYILMAALGMALLLTLLFRS